MGNTCCAHERSIIRLIEDEVSIDLGSECINIDPSEPNESEIFFFNDTNHEIKLSPLSSLLIQNPACLL